MLRYRRDRTHAAMKNTLNFHHHRRHVMTEHANACIRMCHGKSSLNLINVSRRATRIEHASCETPPPNKKCITCRRINNCQTQTTLLHACIFRTTFYQYFKPSAFWAQIPLHFFFFYISYFPCGVCNALTWGVREWR